MRNHVNFVTHRTGTPLTNARHWENFAITADRRDISHAYADKEKKIKRKVRNVTEDESEATGESDQSETSIHRLERMNRIADRKKSLATIVIVNGIEKEFIVDTASPISIMPVGEYMMKRTEIQKVKHRYQDVNKNVYRRIVNTRTTNRKCKCKF